MASVKTIQDLMNEIGKHLPNATFGEDLDGQLVIYTDMVIDASDNLIPIESGE